MNEKLILYICDDNFDFACKLKKDIDEYLKNNNREYETVVFEDGLTMLKQCDKQFPTAVLLDIDMPKMDGFEVASLLQKRKKDVLILFVTNHEDKVFHSYDTHPFWFIRKSHMHDLQIALPKLIQQIDADNEKKRLLFNLKAENQIIEIDINTLTYIESYKNNIVIHDRITGEKQIRCKISEAERQLYALNIIRIQNSILVNCRYISKITSRDVILTNGVHLSLSRSKADYVKKEYQNFIRRVMV